MPAPDTSRRITPSNLQQDIDSYNGLKAVSGYTTARVAATPETLQKAYAEKLIDLITPASGPSIITMSFGGGTPAVNVKNTDVISVARGELKALQAEINAAIPGTTDKMSKYHLQDVADRIKKGLDPK